MQSLIKLINNQTIPSWAMAITLISCADYNALIFNPASKEVATVVGMSAGKLIEMVTPDKYRGIINSSLLFVGLSMALARMTGFIGPNRD
jgi:hypothetical protein